MSRKNYVEKEGFCVVEVDIVLLHLQYMAFLRHHKQVKFVNSEHTIPNIGYFLGMIVLPNMLISHFNQVIINRFCLETDEMMSETMDYCGTSFYINPNSKLIENDIAEVFKNAKEESDGSRIIKTPWQALNRMTRGGLRLGHLTTVAGLAHNNKSGFCRDLFIGACVFNEPAKLMKDFSKKPICR